MKRLIIYLAVIGFFLGGGHAPKAFALSFGAIEIKSKFGEKFKAEIELISAKGAAVDVSIGDPQVYQKLGLERAPILDTLSVQLPALNSRGKPVVRVNSSRPLFFPSFNLVVVAKHEGGTLFETFMISVDFKKNLSLRIQGRQKKEESGPGKAVPPPPQDLARPEPPSIQFQPPEPKERAMEVASLSEATSHASPKAPSVPQPALTQPGPSAPSRALPASLTPPRAPAPRARAPQKPVGYPHGKRPDSALAQDQVHRPFAPSNMTSVQDLPKPVVPAKTPVARKPIQITRNLPVKPLPQVPSVRKQERVARNFHKVRRGESLFSVAKHLRFEPTDRPRAAVAIWMDNQNQFINGNIHRVRRGAALNLDHLNARFAMVDRGAAIEILGRHWRERKSGRRQFVTPTAVTARVALKAPALPTLPANKSGKEAIFNMLQDWKVSWEQGDLPHHMAHFSKRAGRGPGLGYANLQAFKKRLFKRHNQVRIFIHRPNLQWKQGQLQVSFDQSFSSDKMESFGRKDITVIREKDQWKILREKFTVKDWAAKGKKSPGIFQAKTAAPGTQKRISPFVIHASSHRDYPTAIKVSNQLRKQGYSAYPSVIKAFNNQDIFRVFIGRYSDWNLVSEVTRDVRKLDISRTAVPLRSQYAILTGVYGTEAEAQQNVEMLRLKGFAPFMFMTGGNNFSNPTFQVLLGAYEKEAETNRISEKLAMLNIPYRLATP